MARFKKILVSYGSEGNDSIALELAVRLAQDSGGSLTVAQVIPPLPQDVPSDLHGMDDLRTTLSQAAQANLDKAVEGVSQSNVPIQTRVLWGYVAMEITREVMRAGHDLVMKASGRERGISGQLLGSVDMRLLRKCPCPVWLVKEGGHEYLTSILAAVDPTGTDEDHRQMNDSIVQLGLSLAEVKDAELHVLHSWSAWGSHLLRSRMRSEEFTSYVRRMRSRAAKAMTELLRDYDEAISPLNRHLMQGDPGEVVPEFVRSHGIDLVVMGTVGRTGVPGFLIGNTAEMILGRVDCSILAVKPPGFSSPVELEEPS
jgi:nucleotide-binding universal stress UspA family protein